MKTIVKVLSILLICTIGFFYIKSENYKKEMKENSIRIENEINKQNELYSLDSADRARRNEIEIARMMVDKN
jgi:uncharacterized protein YxeA